MRRSPDAFFVSTASADTSYSCSAAPLSPACPLVHRPGALVVARTRSSSRAVCLVRLPVRWRVTSRERLTAPLVDEVGEVGAVAGDDPGSPSQRRDREIGR